MNGQVSEQGVQICMRLSKLTSRALFKAIVKFLAYARKNRQELYSGVKQELKQTFADWGNKENTGKQSVKQLVGQGQGVSSIELDAVKGFDKVARKYGVDYAVRKNDDGKYLIFFKAKDADALTAAFSEFTSKKMDRAERPSLRERIQQAKERIAARRAEKVKKKTKENLGR